MSGQLSRLEDGSELSWVLVKRDDGRVLGNLSLRPQSDGVEIGFVLARQEWGKGLAVEAGGAALQWLDEAYGPVRVWGSCDAENSQSARVLEKLGLVEVRLERASRLRPNLSDEPRDSRIFERAVDAV